MKKHQARQQLNTYAQRFPDTAQALQQAADPSVERLLEGFCHLTDSIETQIDNMQPSLAYHVLNCVWPTCLEVQPSVGILACELPRQVVTIDSGSLFESRDAEEPVILSAIQDSVLLPVSINSVKVQQHTLHLSFQAEPGWSHTACDQLTVWIDQQALPEQDLIQLITQHGLSLSLITKDRDIALPLQDSIQTSFDAFESPLPLINRFFQQAAQFSFLTIANLSRYLSEVDDTFTLRFEFNPVCKLNPLAETAFHLHCLPVINQFSAACDPILLEPGGDAYPIQAGKSSQQIVRVARCLSQTPSGKPLVFDQFYLKTAKIHPLSCQRLPEGIRLFVDSQQITRHNIVSIDAMVHQPDAMQRCHWMSAQFIHREHNISARFYQKPSPAFVFPFERAKAILSVWHVSLSPKIQLTTLKHFLKTLCFSTSPAHHRLIDSVVALQTEYHYACNAGVFSPVVRWRLTLSADYADNLMVLQRFALLLTRLIELGRPVNTCYEIDVQVAA